MRQYITFWDHSQTY